MKRDFLRQKRRITQKSKQFQPPKFSEIFFIFSLATKKQLVIFTNLISHQ